MTTIGNRSHIVTLSPASPKVTITGPITAYGAAMAYGQGTLYAAVFGPAAGLFTIWNDSTVISAGTSEMGVGILLGQTGSVLNAGLVSGGNGIELLNGGTSSAPAYLENTGTILGYGTVNYGLGLADGPEYGAGILAMVAGGVVNAGTIFGNNAGILFRAAAAALSNTGVITSAAGYAVYLQGPGTVANAGAIYGYLQGVFIGDALAGTAENSISARVVTNAGTIAAGAAGYAGIAFISDAIEILGPGTVSNFAGGTITDPAGNGVFLFAGGNPGALPAGVSNAGLIQALYGVEFYGAGTLGNSGAIIGQNIGAEIFNAAGAGYNTGLIEATGSVTAGGTPTAFLGQQSDIFTNTSTGTVTAPGGNAILLRQGGTIANAGGIFGGLAGILGTAGTAQFVIDTTGSVTGYAYGIYLTGAAHITNTGFLRGMGAAPTSSTEHYFSTGLFLQGGAATVYNGSTGTIFSRSNYAVEIMALTSASQPAQITNAGLIEGLGGLKFYGLGGVVNESTILGTAADGIVLHYNGPGVLAGSVINTGLIQAALTALYANGPALVANEVDGVIKAHDYGVHLAGASASYLANSGYIGGNVAVELAGGSTLENAGTLAGVSLGAALLGGGTIIEDGVIAGGGGGAIYFQPGFHNLLVLEPGAEILGKVAFGGGTLQLAGNGGEGVVALKTLSGFTALTIDAGAEWEFSGKTSLAKTIAVLNDGTVKQSAGGNLTIAGALSGAGTIDMAKAALVLNGAVAAGQVIAFSGTGETLALGAAKSFRSTLEHFKLGDTIDLTSIALSAITGLTFSNGVLTLTEASGALHFAFASPKSFGNETFSLAAAGPGTDITLAKPGALPTDWPTASWLPVLTL
jgi:hypothetical protein